ncbi:MAG: ABC-type cobalamin/Fe(3+)-siderophores transport system ATPase component [Candidatus Methanohalarchaeum thermophilum]|uniref:ABC-type cobalamin/Fe(3+)-siderophores transport system ATPase component n=1 Tax=Methanohalarchaeum thermophilum TaxID=1903181 RepID=A0A1Q6DVW2_METT1|nr:MAG: ABC-type cobalamin/Fe(3+)-siderophores transport system ATPase component [Candidatus Methanohalarchaeum thermophilum]
MVKLEIKNLKFSYNSKPTLDDCELKLKENEVLAIIGPNASGKTTLLKCVNRILEPDQGSIYIREKNIQNLGKEEIAQEIGHVPQEEGGSFPSTVFNTVLMGRKPYINWKPSNKDIEIVSNILEKLDLKNLAMRDINELSGGQKQKVVMARALAQEPEILLLDEPTSNLDLKHQIEVMEIVEEQTKNGVSTILAIHDLNLASKYSDKIIMLKNGKIHAAGEKEILTPENIEPVYEIKVDIIEKNNHKVVLPKTKTKEQKETCTKI